MTTNPVALTHADSAQAEIGLENEALRVVENVGAVDFTQNIRANSISTSGGDGSRLTAVLDQNADENMDPSTAILNNPQWDVATLAAAASFDLVVPAAMLAARGNTLWNLQLRGQGSFTNGGGTLEQFFLEKLGLVDENGERTDKDDNAADAYIEMHERREEAKREMEENRAATFSEAEIDAMSWVGDPDTPWTFDGHTSTRRQLLSSAKLVRKTVQQQVANGEISEENGAEIIRHISQYEVATINNDHISAAAELRQVPPTIAAALTQQTHNGLTVSSEVNASTARAATSAASSMVSSTYARDSALSQADAAEQQRVESASDAQTTSYNQTTLSHSPNVQITEEFTIAASSNPIAQSSITDHKIVASATPPVVPSLNRSFSI